MELIPIKSMEQTTNLHIQKDMIQPKDLRIGNLLIDNKTKSYLKVIELTEKDSIFHVIDRTKFTLPDGWKAEPIPITHDLLIKSHFMYVNGQEYRLKDSPFDYYLCDKTGILTVYFNYEFLKCIQYVHELQNFHYTIFGKEINIKI